MLLIHACDSIFSLAAKFYHHRDPSTLVTIPSPRSSIDFKALTACTDFHEDTLTPSSVDNKCATESIYDVSRNQLLPDYELQRTPKCARQIQPENPGHRNLDSSMVTVEDFLKRSNKRGVKRQYGKPKRRTKRLGDNSALFKGETQQEILGSDAGDTSEDVMQLRSKKIRRATSYESSSDESSPDHEESRPLQIKGKKNRNRMLKPLKERLYEAAVLTHGNPDDILVHGATTDSELASSRRPLCFIPSTQPELDDHQVNKSRPRTWTLVDPRKSMAIRSASFSSKTRPCLQHIDSTSSGKTSKLFVRPPRRWKFADASLANSSLTNLKSKRQPNKPAVKTFEYPPLIFVSLKEAEEDYKSMFSYDR